jgi:SpoVK/Ycf46/Vps4 family AAA+-type ATPase
MVRRRPFRRPSLLAAPPVADAAVDQPYASDLEYLQDELAWIHARINRIHLGFGLEPAGASASLYLAANDESQPDPRELAELHASAHTTEAHARDHIDARLAASRAAGRPVALDRLCAQVGLDGFERQVLLLAVAPIFSRTFGDQFPRLHVGGGSSSLDVETTFQFAEFSYAERIQRRPVFAPKGALSANDLVQVNVRSRLTAPEDLLGACLQLSQPTFQFLIGHVGLGDEFQHFSSLEEPRAILDQIVLPEADRRRILSVVDRHDQYLQCRADWGLDELIRYGRGVLMLFHGKPGTGKTMTAHGVARHLGKRVLNVDIPAFLESREADRFLPGLFREARLHNALLFFDECETLFASRRYGNALMTLLLSEIERFEGVAVLATNLPEMLDDAFDRRILVKVHFAEPDRLARADIWRKHLPAPQPDTGRGGVPLAADVDLQALADRYELTGGYIKNAVLAAVATVVHEGAEARQVTMAVLEQAAKDQLRRFDDPDSVLHWPKARLIDVVLAPGVRDQVRELVDAARHRRTALERWGIGCHLSAGKGIAALLSGPPGTGKTLCAEAVANELHRPLVIAQVPALLSKWVGETEQNLSGQFASATRHGAVLLFDEADALLTDRDEAAHRHDVSMVNVLLQLIERHDGVVLLATNRAEALDRALARRLGWHLRFSLPDGRLRAAIWRAHLPDTVPTLAGIDFDRLGRTFAMTGGHIKNAVFRAAFRAARDERPLCQLDLELAAAEETEVLEPVVLRAVEG